MSRIKCNLIRYCDYRFGFCRCFEGYEDYCIDLCPKHNNSLFPASERKRIKKQNKKWRKIREKERNILRLNRMNRLIERLKNEEFSAILTKDRDRIIVALSKFYIKKYEKKLSFVVEIPNFGVLHFYFYFDNSDDEKLIDKKTIYLESFCRSKYHLELNFKNGEKEWWECML